MGNVASMGARRSAYRILVGRTDGKGPLRRPRRLRTNNIEMDFQGVGWRGVDWLTMAYCRDSWSALVYAAMNLIKYGEFLDYLNIS